jgi:hypothetical protein
MVVKYGLVGLVQLRMVDNLSGQWFRDKIEIDCEVIFVMEGEDF